MYLCYCRREPSNLLSSLDSYVKESHLLLFVKGVKEGYLLLFVKGNLFTYYKTGSFNSQTSNLCILLQGYFRPRNRL